MIRVGLAFAFSLDEVILAAGAGYFALWSVVAPGSPWAAFPSVAALPRLGCRLEGDITAVITGRRLKRWLVRAQARELVWLTVGHQLAVDTGAMAAKRMPGIKIGWFGH